MITIKWSVAGKESNVSPETFSRAIGGCTFKGLSDEMVRGARRALAYCLRNDAPTGAEQVAWAKWLSQHHVALQNAAMGGDEAAKEVKENRQIGALAMLVNVSSLCQKLDALRKELSGAQVAAPTELF